jgi:hypothetical protein
MNIKQQFALLSGSKFPELAIVDDHCKVVPVSL